MWICLPGVAKFDQHDSKISNVNLDFWNFQSEISNLKFQIKTLKPRITITIKGNQ